MRAIHFLLVFLLCSIIQNNAVAQSTLKDTVPAKSFKPLLAIPFALRSPETGWGFGGIVAYFFKTKRNEVKLRTSDVNFVGLYTLKKQVLLVLGSTVYFSNENRILRYFTSVSYYPDKFWGIGNNTLADAQESYSLKQFFINPQLLTRTIGDFYVGATYEFQRVYEFTYNKSGVFDNENIKGIYGGNTSGIGVLATLDRRNNAFSPDSGFFTELNFTAFDKRIGSDFNFSTLKFDARKFIRINSTGVLALQALSQINTGIAPIRNLSFLGGSDIMRGYYKGRYTDNNMMEYQAEYRQHFIGRFGGVGFISTGKVSNRVNNFALNQFHFAYGAGLRIMLKKSERLNLRIDYGFGKKTNGLYVVVKEAF